jgi:hypothetical protein
MIKQHSHSEGRNVLTDDENINYSPDSPDSHTIKLNKDESEYIGNDISYKNEDVIRVGLINIRGIPKDNDNPKNNHTRTMIDAAQFDHTGITEVNRQWTAIRPDHQWHQRTKGWWQCSKSVISNNRKDVNHDDFQPGGTISLTTGDLTHRIVNSGQDPLLGRWSWTSYRGCNSIVTTIITGYRPCRNMGGSNTTYQQHKRVLDVMQIDTCPRERWLNDLNILVKHKQSKNEQLIIIADFNEDVCSKRMKKWAHNVNLKEIITEATQSSPPTCNNGTKTIDGIFTSHSIHAVQAGYSEFGLFNSDHRALWIDVKKANILGFKPPNFIKPAARRLQCGVPSVKKRWKQLYTQQLRNHNLLNKQFILEKEVVDNKGHITSNQQQRFEDIMTTRLNSMTYAEQRCRKLKMGNLPFSPDTAAAQTQIELLQAVITKKGEENTAQEN